MRRLPLTDQSHVGAARRDAVRLATEAGWSDDDQARLAVVVTELSSNTLRHGGGGDLLIGTCASGAPGIEAVWIDRGPGMANPEACLRDGFSTSGTSGTGFGAARRMSNQFDVYSQLGQGTAVLVRMMPTDHDASADLSPAGWDVGVVAVAKPGEDVSGDGWAVRGDGSNLSCVVVDGLGHGPLAAAAARAGTIAFQASAGGEPVPALQRIHEAMRGTRGGAVSVARIDPARREVAFAGIGNVAGAIAGLATRRMVSVNGTAGGAVPRLRAFDYPYIPPEAVILHSDGISTNWSIGSYPGLLTHDPTLVAAVLFRDHGRGRDDATVLVAREGAA